MADVNIFAKRTLRAVMGQVGVARPGSAGSMLPWIENIALRGLTGNRRGDRVGARREPTSIEPVNQGEDTG